MLKHRHPILSPGPEFTDSIGEAEWHCCEVDLSIIDDDDVEHWPRTTEVHAASTCSISSRGNDSASTDHTGMCPTLLQTTRNIGVSLRHLVLLPITVA